MNNFRPHILVLAEDDANNAIANGFLLHDQIDLRQTRILPPAKCWPRVHESFVFDYAWTLRKFPERNMVLLVDFDQRKDRYEKMNEGIPSDVADRVFVIGLWTEPEDAKVKAMGGKEALGLSLANDCFENRRNTWGHELLQHNSVELERMNLQLHPILFAQAR